MFVAILDVDVMYEVLRHAPRLKGSWALWAWSAAALLLL